MAHKIADDVTDVLHRSTCTESRLTLPSQLERKLYERVAKVLEISGFKWSRKEKCHLALSGTAGETLAKALDDGSIVDPKKEFDFFQTPEDLADRMARLLDIKSFERILEPSAGGGRLVRAVIDNGALRQHVFAVEAQKDLRKELCKICCVHDMMDDFLTGFDPKKNGQCFEKIIANFPFSNFADITHCRHAYDFLTPGGRMVCITGPSWQYRTDKKSVAFKEWFESLPSATVEELPAGTFKDSGTNVRSLLLVINKE